MFLEGFVRHSTLAGLQINVFHKELGVFLLAAPAAEDLVVGDLVYVDGGWVYKDKRTVPFHG